MCIYRILFVFFVTFFMSCGGATSYTLSSDDLAGTYTLTSFLLTLSDGSTFSNEDLISYSGSMRVTSNGRMTETITVGGSTSSASASYTVITANSITVTPDSYNCSYNMGINRNGNTLTTITQPGQCGSTYKEVDTWTRTSSSASLVKPLSNNDFYFGDLGGLFSEFFFTENID